MESNQINMRENHQTVNGRSKCIAAASAVAQTSDDILDMGPKMPSPRETEALREWFVIDFSFFFKFMELRKYLKKKVFKTNAFQF